MSRAVVIRQLGGPEVLRLEERGDAAPGENEIAVENAAIGLNFIDIYRRTGLYPVSLPAVLGGEGVGAVTAIGAAVSGFAPGERVAYMSAGAYASRTLANAGMAVKVPAGLSSELAAAAFLKGLTAAMLVRDVFALGPGDKALVYAAAGGVGSILTQWAAHLGAEVIAVVGETAKAKLAKDYGAAHVIVRAKTDSIAADVRRLTHDRGVDVVYDSVGAATFEASLDSLALRGMMVSYGNASGAVPPMAPLELNRRGSLFLTRPSLAHYATPERLPAMAALLFAMIEKGHVKIPAPTVFPLEKTADAHRLLESGKSTGAIVLRP
ncbi:MAG: quinone oxidoreductase [Amphiplicatus sp.]